VREVIKTKGAIVCEVTDEESHRKTMTRVQKIVSAVIFSTATFALTSSLGDRYAKYSRPVGATILILLGLLLLGCLYSAQFEFLEHTCRILW
jgi:hypothetical protein